MAFYTPIDMTSSAYLFCLAKEAFSTFTLFTMISALSWLGG